MTQPSTLFSSGLQLAPFVISSGLLRRSWGVISSNHEAIVSNEGLSWKVYKEPDTGVTIIAFEATADSSNLQADLVSSSELREKNFLHFDFLCTKNNPVFNVNSTAVSLFSENYQKLDQLKSELNVSNSSTTKLIVTGHALGGSVASLFTISLLNSIGSGNNRPLCITFGSPLVGDKKLQQAISRSSNWNSCFLHVVSHKDPLPRLFIPNSTSSYMPFGTFLLCSDASSTCFENPNSSLELLMAFSSIDARNEGFQSAEYGNIVKNLKLKALHKDFITKSEDLTYPTDSLASCISLQLRALGLTPDMQKQLQNIDINDLETNMKKQEEGFIKQRRIAFDPSKKLNQIKENMAQLEWYKKETKNQGIGYYDSYKNMNSPWDNDVVQFHKKLKIYWEKMVEEVEMKPQTEGAAFRKRWLYGGTTYRRMVEPLAIAQYYKDGGKDYVKERSKHFKQLEAWLEEANAKVKKDLESTSKKSVEVILTIDSCFWAHVEEALRSCKELKGVREKEVELKKFEEYVYELLKNYAVSPEIFLEKSSFMRWWIEYKGINGASYSSPLTSFMKDARNREQYALGAYDFP